MPKTKLPKQIAGIKLPKRLRRTGGLLLHVARHPLALELAATAVIAAAAALVEDDALKQAAARARQGKGPVHGMAGRAGEALASALRRRDADGKAPTPRRPTARTAGGAALSH